MFLAAYDWVHMLSTFAFTSVLFWMSCAQGSFQLCPEAPAVNGESALFRLSFLLLFFL